MKYILPILVVLTSVIGSLANTYIGSDDWYTELIKSPLNPPSYVFGIVWPILYIMMAFISFKVADKISSIFIFQLILNAAWSWIFFFFQAPVIAFVDIGILIYLNHPLTNSKLKVDTDISMKLKEKLENTPMHYGYRIQKKMT